MISCGALITLARLAATEGVITLPEAGTLGAVAELVDAEAVCGLLRVVGAVAVFVCAARAVWTTCVACCSGVLPAANATPGKDICPTVNKATESVSATRGPLLEREFLKKRHSRIKDFAVMMKHLPGGKPLPSGSKNRLLTDGFAQTTLTVDV